MLAHFDFTTFASKLVYQPGRESAFQAAPLFSLTVMEHTGHPNTKILLMRILLIITFIFVSNSSLFGQTSKLEFYKKSYDYLQKEIKIDTKAFQDDCKQVVAGAKVKIKPKLQVASKFNGISRGFPLCDLLQKKYKIQESCVYALGSGEFRLTYHVEDSLKNFWKDYKPEDPKELQKIIGPLISTRKNGYQIFFSDVYKNTLAAEVKSFCLDYDQFMWFGGSTFYYFVFNENKEIIEVYFGETINYN